MTCRGHTGGAVIPTDLFHGRAQAHIHYASGLPPEEADPIFRAQLVAEEPDNAWTAAPEVWVQAATRVDERLNRTGTGASLLAALAERLVGIPISLDHHEFLPQVVAGLVRSPATESTIGPVLRSLLGGYAESAKAGDANLMAELLAVATRELSLAADMLAEQHQLGAMGMGKDRGVVEIFQIARQLDAKPGHPPSAEAQPQETLRQTEATRRTGLLRCFVPLARWMLQKGSAELRRSERAPLLATVLECLVDGEPAEQQLALSYISLNAQPQGGFWRRQRVLFWSTAEKVLTQGTPDWLMCELAASMYRGNWFAEDCTLPLSQPQNLPHARQALLRGLLDGRFDSIPDRFLPVAWEAAFSHPIGEETTRLRFSHARTLDRALRELDSRAARTEPPDTLGEWARHLAREWIRIHGLRAKELQVLAIVAERQAVAGDIRTALRNAIEESRPTRDTPLALRILNEPGEVPGRIRSVLALKLADPLFTYKQPERHQHLIEEFRRIIHFPWSGPIFGIDLGQMIQAEQVRDIGFTQLDQGDLVRSEKGLLYLHEPPYKHMAETIADEEEFLATTTLYFLHEWVHVHQGIGRKQTVETLRETGSESTLMHLDLSADHAAALLAQRATPRWGLSWLKDVQGRSLLEYLAGRGHTAASRSRKTTRLVSLRIDFLARVATRPPNWLDQLGGGYAFTDLSPGGGAMLLLVSGPPFSVVDHTRLAAEQVTLLTTAMDEGEGLADRLPRIDVLLRDSFRLR
jgi:hypothetical protein